MGSGSTRVLITGAGRAIGRATAVELADRGHQVIATARNISGIEAHPGVTLLPLDVNDDVSVEACLAEAGPVDVLINNAAAGGIGPLETFPLDHLRMMFETNTLGMLRMVQAVVPSWRERGSGTIINISSVHGQVTLPNKGPYAATKFALEALSETLAAELRHFGIRVVIIQPGYVAPGMKEPARYEGPPEYAEMWTQYMSSADRVSEGGDRTPTHVAATAIADLVTESNPPLRVRVGDDANKFLDARKALSDSEFEDVVRSTLGITW